MKGQDKIPQFSAKNSTLAFLQRFDALKNKLLETEEATAARIGYSRSWVQKVRRGDVIPKAKPWAALEAAERRARIDELGEQPASARQAVEEVEQHKDCLKEQETAEMLEEAKDWKPGDPLPPMAQAMIDAMKQQFHLPSIRVTGRAEPNDADRKAAAKWKKISPKRESYSQLELLLFLSKIPNIDDAHVLRLLIQDGYNFDT